jgi:HSP90 family molecular chaperone
MKFDFLQVRAFRLIENMSIYRTQKFIFIREIVQNAIDATQLQLWREIRGKYEKDALSSPFALERYEPGIFDRFKITITASYNEEKNNAIFAFEDRGIGISNEELKNNILTTGRSWHERNEYKEELDEMPDWLKTKLQLSERTP